MAQVIVYFDESYPNEFVQRDYLQGRLYKPLTSGKSYCVTFYVTLTQFSEYASNQVGAYLDNGMIDTTKRPSLPQTEYTPQIIETSIIDDTLNWIKVQGSFTATGNEKYITIGNFSDKAHTSAVALPYSASNFTWYLVDDVSVIDAAQKANAGPDKLLSKGDSVYIGTSDEGMPCTWYVLGNTTPIGYSGGIWVKPASTTSYVIEMDLCGNVTYDTMKVVVAPAGIGNVQMQKHANAQIFPNPANDEMTIEDAANGTMCVYNLMGQQVFAAAIVSEKQILRISDLALGTYIVQITFDDGSRQSMRLVKG